MRRVYADLLEVRRGVGVLSTNYSRTMWSAHHLLQGLLSEEQGGATPSLPPIRVPPWSEEVINAFEGPQAMELVGLCRRMEESEEFMKAEQGMDVIRALIVRHVPAFCEAPSKFRSFGFTNFFRMSSPTHTLPRLPLSPDGSKPRTM